ncbi:MAG: hypothetical protein LBG93_05705 [Treponema sp.]|nr:hypothetical protein [Treponema sp.]
MDIHRIIQRVTGNWPAKVLSIGLAIMLVVFHRISSLEERFFTVPLTIERDGVLVPASPYPRMVRVNLRGEPASIFSILESDIEVYVEVDRFQQPGIYTVPVQWRIRAASGGMEPVQITVEPMEITLTLDHRLSRAVPITAVLRGQIEAGHIMTSYSLDPPQVIIEGPARLISEVSEIFTEVIDLDGRRGDFSLAAAILPPDPLTFVRGSGVSEFRGNITQVIPVRNIANVPIAITGLSDELSGVLEIASATLRLEGQSQDTLNLFSPTPGFLRVDGSGIDQPGMYILRVLTAQTENMLVRVEPEEVMIYVSLNYTENY